MATPLHLLILEDSHADAELMVEALREGGFDPRWDRVETEADYMAHLEKGPDIILADYSLPGFDAQRALRLLRDQHAEIPFIIVSGCIGEEVAVDCMKQGATDYLIKDRLARLAPAVKQALDQKRLQEEKRRAEDRLLYEAFHDTLTGLPNRALLLERLGRCVLQGRRNETYLFAVLFLDLDGFKVVNDGLGHDPGDQLLVAVAQRLCQHVRSGDTVARLGGDEFVLLLEDVKAVSNATRVADRIQQELTKAFSVHGRDVFTSGSIGIACSTTGYDRPEDALRDSGTALVRAKGLGKNRFVMFDSTMHTQAMARLKLETDLRHAMTRNEFHLYYQPIISLSGGAVVGFEALLRWRHPERGVVTPDQFLTVAEEIGLLVPIGQWVLMTACHSLRAWQDRFKADPPLSVGVNLSCKQFLQLDLLTIIDQTLLESGLDPHSLKLEITETVMMENPESATETLYQLRRRQIETYMDDFGTGYSSLSYLQRFPIDTLKVDHSFITRMETNQESLEIVRTIVALAHNLGRKVVAEGVESPGQLSLLKKLGCDFGQGHLFSKPLAVDAVPQFLASGQRW